MYEWSYCKLQLVVKHSQHDYLLHISNFSAQHSQKEVDESEKVARQLSDVDGPLPDIPQAPMHKCSADKCMSSSITYCTECDVILCEEHKKVSNVNVAIIIVDTSGLLGPSQTDTPGPTHISGGQYKGNTARCNTDARTWPNVFTLGINLLIFQTLTSWPNHIVYSTICHPTSLWVVLA